MALLQPMRYDPSAPGKAIMDKNNTFETYESIAARNPFTKATHRETLKQRECFFPPAASPSAASESTEEWQTIHVGYGYPLKSQSSSSHKMMTPQHSSKSRRPTSSAIIASGSQHSRPHQRSHSQPESPPIGRRAFDHVTTKDSKVPKSTSDGNFPDQSITKFNLNSNFKPEANEILSNGRTEKRKATATMKPLSNAVAKPTFTANMKPTVTAITKPPVKESTKPSVKANVKQGMDVQQYKVSVRTSGNSELTVRSPMKKLFGEKGILGRTSGEYDAADPRFTESGKLHWTEKLKSLAGDIGNQVASNISLAELGKMRRSKIQPVSTFAISLSPYAQADIYMQLELLLQEETNEFIKDQLAKCNVSVDSVRKVVENWQNKGRSQVVEFRYDLSTQRDLVVYNIDTMEFGGINAFNQHKVRNILTIWKVLAKELSLRTFCQPDSAVKKHLRDAEQVFKFIDASMDGMFAYADIRGCATMKIRCAEESKHARKGMEHGVETIWEPEGGWSD